jgi:hypothetical protein
MAAVQKRAIPNLLNANFAEAVKENIEIITGRRPGLKKINKLSTTATTADVIAKINEILDRLQ